MFNIRFIEDKNEFNSLLSRAQSGIIKIIEPLPEQKFLYFDAIDTGTPEYFYFIRNLTKFSNSSGFSFLLAKPEQIDIFYKNFNKYPAMKFDASHNENDYLRFISADPGGSLDDALICVGELYAVLPDSNDWIIYADRDSEISTIYGSPEIYEFTRKNYPFNVFFKPDVYGSDFY
ncbi:hypothetical protein [Paraburkholderia hayleyella]|uniref:hypothetical protein n=1 Tax=Paraburkholderia hayleyella TaxID=2152889 RepID=UPI001291773A|nr:hypothetical protein [Paraburkholderia hayleyella]